MSSQNMTQIRPDLARFQLSTWRSILLFAFPALPDSFSAASASDHETLDGVLDRWYHAMHVAYDHDVARHYHTIQHLASMWGTYVRWVRENEVERLAARDEAVVFCAIVFHECVG